MAIPHKTIQHFLASHPLGTIATLSKKGDPELATVYFLVNDDLSCYIVTKAETRKYKNIVRKSFGALMCHAEDELISVEISGTYEPIFDTIEVVVAIERFQALAEKRSVGYWIPPIAQLNAGAYVVVKLKPTQVQYRRYVAAKGGSKKMTEIVLRRKQKQLVRL